MAKLSSLLATAGLARTAPQSLAGGATLSLTARRILGVDEQVAGQTFNIGYTAETDYVQENAATGTDASGGAFTLANSAGAVIDADTKLLIHADGANGSAEIVDERGIRLFGTNCAYFDGASSWTIPKSSKLAFTSRPLTFECWFRPASGGSGSTRIFTVAANTSGTETLYVGYDYGAGKFSAYLGTPTNVSGTHAADAWYHLAVVSTGSAQTLYINGTSVAARTGTLTLGESFLFLGSDNTGGGKALGWMDQFRISKVARYAGAFTPPTVAFTADADTVHLFQFDDGHGSQFIRDTSRSGLEVWLNSGSSLSTARSRFGTSSLAVGASGGIIVNPGKPHADFALGSDDFTVDFWAYVQSDGRLFHGCATNPGWGPILQIGGGNLIAYLSTNGSSFNIANGANLGPVTFNAWHHFAMTRSGANLHIFMDGTLLATYGVGTASLFTDGKWFFGCDYAGGSQPTANFDEIRVKRAQAVWTSAFTPPAGPYGTDEYTILLLHFEGADGDKVTLDGSENSYGTNAFGDAVTPVLTFANSAALSTAQTRGGNGTSLALNGTNQCASIQFATPSAGHLLYFANREQFCIEGWFYFTSVSSQAYLWNLQGTDALKSIGLYLNAGGVPSLYINNSGVVSGATLTAGTWNHVAAVFDQRGWAVCVNGVISSFASASTTLPYSTEPYNLILGARSTAASIPMSGAIDSFRITHGKPRYTANFTPGNLTQDDDTALLWVFNGASGQKWVKELSKNTALIQAAGARTVRDGAYVTTVFGDHNKAPSISTANAKFGTSSLFLDGAGNAYLAMPHQAGLAPQGDFTIECWVKAHFAGATRNLMNKTGSDNASSSYSLLLDNNNIPSFTLYNGANAYTLTVAGVSLGGNTDTNPWTHLAFTLSGTTLRAFVNGTLHNSMTVPGSMNPGTGVPLRIMQNCSGHIDELRISSTARWTANFTPPTLPYGQQHALGPHWVATKPGVSSLDLSAFSSIDNAAFSGSIPATTTLKFLISTDAYATPLKRWTGSAWVSSGHSMVWNAGTGTLTTTAGASDLGAAGNGWAELAAGLQALDVSDISSLNLVAVLSTANPNYSPVLDAVTLTMDEYTDLKQGTDYTVRYKDGSLTAQPLTITRTKAGTGMVTVTYMP